MFSQDDFLHPSDDYRGTDFWMLNDALTDEGIREQLTEMKKQGVASVIARTYIGLKSDYPGPDFKKHMHTIVDVAREVGIKIFLQAGYMPEAVLNLPEDFALRIITPFAQNEAANKGDVLAEMDGIAYVAVNSKTFLDMFNKDAMGFYLKQSYEDMWKEFEDEYGKTCISVWVDEPSYSASGLPWSPALPEAFRKRWGYDIAPKVPLLYCDVDDYETVRYHYWITVQNLLKTSYFQQVQAWCHAHHLLFSGHLMHEDYLSTQLTRAAACMPYYKYFDIPGIDYLTGDMNWRTAPVKRRYDSLDYRAGLYTTPLQCTSAAHQAGCTQILAEMYGVSTENLTFRDQKNMFDHFASFGINHKSVHGLFYSLRGRGKRAYPPHVNTYQPYWNSYRMVTDACARTSYFISQGTPVKDVVVIHPLSSAACEYRGPQALGGQSPALGVRDGEWMNLELQLMAAQIDFELADEDTLSMWGDTRQDGETRLKIGCMTYATVILPNLKAIAGTTLDILKKFAEKGGRVIVLGQAPHLLDGWPVSDLAQQLSFATVVANTDKLVQMLTALPKSYQLSCSNDATVLHVNHRRDDDADYFFIFNSDCREKRDITLTLSGLKLAQQLCAEGGEPIPVKRSVQGDKTSFSLSIPEGGSVMVLVRDTLCTEDASHTAMVPALVTRLDLGTAWQLELQTPNVLYLEYARYRLGEGTAFSQVYPMTAIHDILTQKDYHGPLTLQFTIHSERAFEHLHVAMENAAAHTISLNGKTIPTLLDGYYMARQFETVPLSVPLQPGKNILEVSRDFVPLAKFKSHITSLFENLPGVELEPMYLVGDFAVHSHRKPTRANGIRLSHEFTLAPMDTVTYGELITSGCPFFAGTAALTQTFVLPYDVSEARLVVVNPAACHIQAILNGIPQGDAGWEPYVITLKNLKKGENILRLAVTNTLRNLLGPHHRPKGEYGECWGGYQFPNLPWQGAVDEVTHKAIPGWWEHRDHDTNAWVEDYMMTPFGLSGAALEW